MTICSSYSLKVSTRAAITTARQKSFPADTGSSSQKEALKNGRKASKDIIYTSSSKSQEVKSAVQIAYEKALKIKEKNKVSDKNDSAKFDTKRQGTVLCLDGNGIRNRGQRHRTVPCPGTVPCPATKNNKRTSDGKDHSFAKDGFTYRRAYFEDFDGQYYEITISVGHKGTMLWCIMLEKQTKVFYLQLKK